ncbi:MAG: hypothetical protein EOL97_12590 [Spirochaetia bacterium]|nr:hypothetical protein [Spirochaetia bacterium]
MNLNKHSFIAFGLSMCNDFLENEEKMIADAKIKMEKAKKLYWDACKYPRKKKKAIRKQAKSDYELYYILSQPINFSWL